MTMIIMMLQGYSDEEYYKDSLQFVWRFMKKKDKKKGGEGENWNKKYI